MINTPNKLRSLSMYTCTVHEGALYDETIYDGKKVPIHMSGIICPTYYDRVPHMHNRNVGLRGGASFKVGVACYIHVTYLNTAMNANKHGGGRREGAQGRQLALCIKDLSRHEHACMCLKYRI